VSFYSFLCQFVEFFFVSVECISAGRDSHSSFPSLFAFLCVFIIFIRSPRLCLHFAGSPVLVIVGVGSLCTVVVINICFFFQFRVENYSVH
jgi:hypothetical protein